MIFRSPPSGRWSPSLFLSHSGFPGWNSREKEYPGNFTNTFFSLALREAYSAPKFLFLIENIPLSDLFSYPKHYLLLRGGLTFYGGFFLALLAFFAVIKKHKESFWKVLDATAPALGNRLRDGKGRLLSGRRRLRNQFISSLGDAVSKGFSSDARGGSSDAALRSDHNVVGIRSAVEN